MPHFFTLIINATDNGVPPEWVSFTLYIEYGPCLQRERACVRGHGSMSAVVGNLGRIRRLINLNDPPKWYNVRATNVSELLPPVTGIAFRSIVLDDDNDTIIYSIEGGRFVEEGLEAFRPSKYAPSQLVWSMNSSTGVISPVVPMDYESGPTLVCDV